MTILEAALTFDSGAVWATHEFPLDGEARTKSSLYRGSVTDAAVRGVLDAIARFESSEHRCGFWQPETVTPTTPGVRGCLRPQMRQADRAIDWTRETMAEIVCKIRAGDSAPGVLGTLFGKNYYLYGAHEGGL